MQHLQGFINSLKRWIFFPWPRNVIFTSFLPKKSFRDTTPTWKIFFGNDPSRGKNMLEIQIGYFWSKKCFPHSRKAYCVLKRKVAKMRFLSKNDLFWGKMYEEFIFESEEFYKCQISDSLYIFTPKGVVFRQKLHFCDFSLQYIGLPWIREAFFHFENVKFGFPACFTPRGVISKKTFRQNATWVAPLLCISSLRPCS